MFVAQSMAHRRWWSQDHRATIMGQVDRPLLSLLHPAVEAARRALGDLDTDEVPARLRRVAADSSRRLPPPLAQRLLDELERSDWLRAKTLEAWPEADPAADRPEARASALFLLRPEGWEGELATMAGGAAGRSEAAQIESLRAQVAELTTELEATRAKLASARRQAVATPKPARERSVAEPDAGLRDALEVAISARDELGRALASANDQIAGLRGELQRARRARPTPRQAPSPWAGRQPEELAGFLDELTAALAVRPVVAPPAVGAAETGRRLPLGVAPDQAGAFTWLLADRRSGTLVVDGYNVGFVLTGGAPPDRTTRERLAVALAQFRRQAAAPWRVIVLYDSAAPPGPAPAPRGVEVRYVPSADQAALDIAAELGHQAVVVSTDRAVREGAESHRALGLWAEALAEWVTARR